MESQPRRAFRFSLFRGTRNDKITRKNPFDVGGNDFAYNFGTSGRLDGKIFRRTGNTYAAETAPTLSARAQSPAQRLPLKSSRPTRAALHTDQAEAVARQQRTIYTKSTTKIIFTKD